MVHSSQVEEAAREVDTLFLEVLEEVCSPHLAR